MVIANFKANKFIVNIFIYCRLIFNNIQQSYSAKLLVFYRDAPAWEKDRKIFSDNPEREK
jgi:hypothetical protein